MERNEYIKNYILNKVEFLKQNNIEINDEQVDNLISSYINSDKELEKISIEIDEKIQKYIDRSIQLQNEDIEEKRLEDLDLDNIGITINIQDIDLMLIANAETKEELEQALSKITQIKVDISQIDYSITNLEDVKKTLFDEYLKSLKSKTEYIVNPRINLTGKINYLITSGLLNEEELKKFKEIIATSTSKQDLLNKVKSTFPDKIHDMTLKLKEFNSIEKDGIKSSSIEAYKNLFKLIKEKYNSLTIDEEFKYGGVSLEDGTFDFRNVQKALDFAKVNGKTVRLNALIFYMDCPEELYNLPINEENKTIVKEKLTKYVDSITKFITQNGYSDTVRSIDVLNELINRFEMNGEPSYMYRGNIDQEKFMKNGIVDDNVKSGWLKHLNIEDLCEIISVARSNMPNTDFMFNDDNLTDPRKIEANAEIISKIKEYEAKHGIKLINSIGTQMHISNDVTKEQIKEMIINLSKFGLPIEITEFDLAMTDNIESLNQEEIERLRQIKINEVYDCIDEIKKERKDIDIKGFTIWSKTDKQNFRVDLANKERISAGLEPIESLHGGYYTEEMKPKTAKNKTLNNTENKKIQNKKELKKVYTPDSNSMGYVSIIIISLITLIISIVLIIKSMI